MAMGALVALVELMKACVIEPGKVIFYKSFYKITVLTTWPRAICSRAAYREASPCQPQHALEPA